MFTPHGIQVTMWPRLSIMNGISNLSSLNIRHALPCHALSEEKVLKQVLMSQLEGKAFNTHL